MSLKELCDQDKLKPHKTSKKEINNLIRVVRRDLKDAKVKGISVDRKFATAYNAVLQTATILLYCRGYKPKGVGYHFTVFQTMKEIMGNNYHDLADYFDACRAKRNITDYDYAGSISRVEVQDLITEAENFLNVVLSWLKEHCPQFVDN